MVKTLKQTVKKIKNIHLSMEQLTSSYNQVRRELWAMGLLVADSPLDEVWCYLEPLWTWGGLRGLGKVMGFYYLKSEGGDGNIHVPAIFPWEILGYERRVLADVLRHEYGHALEDNYKQFVHVKAFAKAFGAAYGKTVVFQEGTEENYVSTYAQTMTQEDFAETFMCYMKYKGEIPKKWSENRAIRAKWSFIDDLRAKIYKQL